MSHKIRRGLLEGDLEQISSKVFDSYHDEITELVGKRHGVYALYTKGRLYYVGLATNLRRRVKHHLKDKHAKKWDTFSLYLIKNVNYLKELESLIVHIAEPKGNTQRGRFANSENLIDSLRDLMEARDKKQREQILSGLSVERKKHTLSKKGSGKRGAPPLRGLLPGGTVLRKVYNGKEFKGIVDKKGCITVDGIQFNSPSQAGIHVRKGKATNGWTFWQFRNEKGQWVYLDELR